MSRKRKFLVIVIVEGISEEDALYPKLSEIGKRLNVRFEIMGTDVFTAKESEGKKSKLVVGSVIKEFTSRPEFNKNDIKMVIQLTDTDGVYITDDKILVDESQLKKTVYSLENIIVNNESQFEEIKNNRNSGKRGHLDTLSKTEEVAKISYKILYFSRNLDHVISNDPDITGSEKSKKADAFSNSFTSFEDFERFFKESDFAVAGTYDETWDFIKNDVNSLKRFSNFHLIFEMLREVEGC